VHLPARFGDVATGTEDDFTVVGAESDFAGQHDRMLVLAGMAVRRGEHADLEGMLDDGHLALVGLLESLDTAPKPGRATYSPSPGWTTVTGI
jgi:hypothetical protein